jgi:hypothetical protein
MNQFFEKVLQEINSDDDFKKAKNLAQRRLDGKPLDLKQQEKLAEEYVRMSNVIRDYVERKGPYAHLSR